MTTNFHPQDMAATLCSYESQFGPYHPQTARLLADVGKVLWRYGALTKAHFLLERSIDLGHVVGRYAGLRQQAIVILRDLLLEQWDYEEAAALQTELLECQVQPAISTLLTTQAELISILLARIDHTPDEEV